jgi:DNA-binding transcriptional MerR regulator
MNEMFLTVIDVAKRCGCSVELVRHYERRGLLLATRTPGGMRIFREKDVDEFARRREQKRLRMEAK